MRLKTLRLSGFKSFADATEFEFPGGITCIVGPNGCGKSNVVDAVKWVLGEQRASALRGTEMGDVIFGGTRSRKPLGMAEVSLLFDNSDGVLEVDFSEVEVTRRLYRDGHSEYLLNRNKCRLRDLRELLMDTGSGPGALTFMEQGRIDQILREGVSERRAVFEEAAGISRYKARRKETLRRLKRVEDDLLRVSDVVAEKERMVRSLKVQAGRAERYKALREEMRAKRLTLAVHHYGRLLEERETATGRVLDLTAREEAARIEVAAAAAACEESETELENSRKTASTTETEIATLEGRTDTAREKSTFSARLVAELDGKIRWYTDEIDGFAERLQEIDGDRVEIRTSVESARADRARREQAVQATDASGARAREEANALRRDVEACSRGHYQAIQRAGAAQNRVSKLDAEERGLGERVSRLAARMEAVETERREAAEREQAAAIEFTGAETLAASSAEHLTGSEARVEELDERVGILRDGVQALDRDVSAMKSRQEVLHALVARMEGVGKGPRRLLEAVQKGQAPLAGVRGLLADLIAVDEDRASLVETALGDYATAVVVDTLPQAVAAVRHLQENRLGRAIVLPLDQIGSRAGDALPLDATASATASALADAVRAEEPVLSAVRSVLADAVVVDSLEDALRLRQDHLGRRLRVLTPQGHVVEPDGAMLAGGAPGGAGILQRNAELRQLEERLAETCARLTAAREEFQGVRTSLTEARQMVVEARQQVRAAEGALHRARGTVERVRAETARAEQEIGRLETSRVEVEQRLGALRDSSVEAAREVAAATEEVARAERARDDVTERFAQAEEASRQAESERADARVELAAIRERCDALEQRAAALEREVGELEQGVDEAREELTRSEQRKKDALERGKVARQEMEVAQRRRDQCVRELIELRHAVSSAQKALEERRALRKELDQHAGGVARELNKFRLRQNEAHVRVENLIERIQEELEVDLHTAWDSGRAAGRAAGDAEDGAEGASTEVADSTPVFAQPEVEPFDPHAYEEQIEELKGKLQRMGAVNLEALEQLEGAQSEAEHLLRHHEDLTKSRESLMEAIRRIDKESRELFVTTFNAIQANFREMFRKLFGGGRADVYLEPGVDVLEAGVEIVARPPGKEQRSISLLSGGERTMTAVALMFAIYMAHPSPFCLLDEVDAALDEGNIDRFVAAVHMFSAQSQFIIVTHNKRTMTTADTIFGVSMPQPGVSRRLAVRLEDIEEDGRLRQTDAA